MSYHTTKTRQRQPLSAVGLWDSRRFGQTMPEPVINRAYVPGLAYESGVPGTIATTPSTLRGLGECSGCHGVGAVQRQRLALRAPLALDVVTVVPPLGVFATDAPPNPAFAVGAVKFMFTGLGLLLGGFIGYKMGQKNPA